VFLGKVFKAVSL